jgi:integrase/recombinase XerD
VKPVTVINLIAPVRELARWLGRRGVEAYVLPGGVLLKPARYIPHIYSDRELAALFEQTDRCRYCPEVPYRHLVMPVLFRTIYACGLRCSEARLLRVKDVEVESGVLQIREAKGGKDRQLPHLRAVAQETRRLPRHARRTARLGVVLPRRHPGRAVDTQ